MTEQEYFDAYKTCKAKLDFIQSLGDEEGGADETVVETARNMLAFLKAGAYVPPAISSGPSRSVHFAWDTDDQFYSMFVYPDKIMASREENGFASDVQFPLAKPVHAVLWVSDRFAEDGVPFGSALREAMEVSDGTR